MSRTESNKSCWAHVPFLDCSKHFMNTKDSSWEITQTLSAPFITSIEFAISIKFWLFNTHIIPVRGTCRLNFACKERTNKSQKPPWKCCVLRQNCEITAWKILNHQSIFSTAQYGTVVLFCCAVSMCLSACVCSAASCFQAVVKISSQTGAWPLTSIILTAWKFLPFVSRRYEQHWPACRWAAVLKPVCMNSNLKSH